MFELLFSKKTQKRGFDVKGVSIDFCLTVDKDEVDTDDDETSSIGINPLAHNFKHYLPLW